MTPRIALAWGLVALVTSQVTTPVVPTGSGLLFFDPSRDQLMLVGGTGPTERPDLMPLWTRRAGSWSRLDGAGPPMRTVSAAAFDTRRGRLVVYGGVGSDPADRRDDTWEWDGARWHAMVDRSAGARDHHAMTFDETRGTTVLFGGVTAPAGGPRPFEGETWTWNGARWQLASTTGPSPRGTALVDDVARQQVLLFGGVGEGQRRLADTWAWNGSSWRLLTESGPPARNGHALVFDRRAGVVLLFGGTSGPQHLDDLWQWDGRRWTEIQIDHPKPGPRVGATMAFDSTHDRTVLYGGLVREDGRVKDSTEMWEWDRRRWTRMR